jgi:hypothetical protein
MRQTEMIEWVPVAEGLPEGPGPYLYTNARGIVGQGTPGYVAGQARIGNIIAWAPLPEPYRADKEGNHE